MTSDEKCPHCGSTRPPDFVEMTGASGAMETWLMRCVDCSTVTEKKIPGLEAQLGEALILVSGLRAAAKWKLENCARLAIPSGIAYSIDYDEDQHAFHFRRDGNVWFTVTENVATDVEASRLTGWIKKEAEKL